MQLLGRPFGEATVYRVAAAYEQAAKWSERHPALS
jgi:Asp-tRNA(Asn)/Glu-tRNA(Gln) amidotransferase A subunit family amidase